jgi:CrcB protein
MTAETTDVPLRRDARRSSRYRSVQLSERLAVAVGGAAGAYARVAVDEIVGVPGHGWPWATFIVNVVGAFLLGYLIARLLERLPPSTYRRPLLGTGFCGALTTFSTLQFELLNMIRTGHQALALAYGTLSALAGFGAFMVAIWLVRRARVTG